MKKSCFSDRQLPCPFSNWELKIDQFATLKELELRIENLRFEIENLHLVQSDPVSENMDAASFTEVDAEVLAVNPSPSDCNRTVGNGRCK